VKKIGVLGCTGSIGRTALSVISNDAELKVSLLVNNSDLDGLKSQIAIFKPTIAVCLGANYIYRNGKEYCGEKISLYDLDLYGECDLVVNGIVGLAGLIPSLSVLKLGKILATANKESFVSAGKIINGYKNLYNGKIYPLDSEHSAVWQLLDGRKNVEKIIITASGGAFRDKNKDELAHCTAREALNHPNWKMGKKVTVDCATLMNKGMEIIEAKHLFGRIPEVIGHRESRVHALVKYADGTYNANISRPDMAIPISYALHYPSVFLDKEDNFSLVGESLNFFELDETRFPCLAIARSVSAKGDIAGCVMASADEILVNAFLKGQIGFYGISNGVEKALDKFACDGDFENAEEVLSMDRTVREYTLNACLMGEL